MRTESQWVDVLVKCGVRAATAVAWAPAFAAEVQPGNFSQGAAEIDDFLSQVLHESGRLDRLEENLNYSVDALLAKFGRHRISEADARRLGRIDGVQKADQVGIANSLYGGPWGLKNLGNSQPGHGWMYRGSGPIQVTGLTNFAWLQAATGIPLVANPDLLRRPGPEPLRVCVAWWEGKVPDSVMGDVRRVRRAVNGGEFGLDDTSRLAKAADLADGVADGRLG